MKINRNNLEGRTLEKLGIPGMFPKDIWKAMEVMKKLEKAGIIKRNGYNLLSPWERNYQFIVRDIDNCPDKYVD